MPFLSNSLQLQYDFLFGQTGYVFSIAADLSADAYRVMTPTLDVPANEGPQYWWFGMQGTYASAPGAAQNNVGLHLQAMDAYGSGNHAPQPGGGVTAYDGSKAGDFVFTDVNTAQYAKPLRVDMSQWQNRPNQSFTLYLLNPTGAPTMAFGTVTVWASPMTWGPKP